MTKTQRFFVTAIAALLASLGAAAAETDTATPTVAAPKSNTVGIEAGFVSLNRSGFAGVYLRHRFSRLFALKPRFDFVWRHHDKDAFMVNIDTHWIAPLRDRRWELFGIVGVGLEAWNVHGTDDSGEPSRSRHSALGIDAGAGISVCPTTSLRLAFEAKGNFLASYSTALLSLSIGYNF